MSRQRGQSTSEGLKGPHTVSLKVLRLSRPSLADHHPLPQQTSSNGLLISPKASLSFPSADPGDPFVLSPVLTLPPAFGSAYVGETFSCTLCANNELPENDETRRISAVRIVAEMQMPSQPAGLALDLSGASSSDVNESATVKPCGSLQKIVRFELKEEGNHVLAVTVTYTETLLAGEGRAASGRVRTFRKLYQFVAQPLMAVRTKVEELPARGTAPPNYALEAQLENLGQSAVSLHAVTVNTKSNYTALSLNWDLDVPGDKQTRSPVLKPRDIMQVAFLLQNVGGAEAPEHATTTSKPGDRRVALGQLNVEWRSAMGDYGSLATGWLSSKAR
ncbi:hypothetical protein BJ546DRAFT_638376 [Cryomyces antarcticus]